MRWVLAALLLPVAAAAQPAPQFHDVEPLDRALTARSYAIFRQHCPGLATAAPYIASVSVDDMAWIGSDDANERDWTIAVSVGIQMRNTDASREWQMENGMLNFVLFTLGGGKDPGISSTGTGYRFCSGVDTGFIQVSDLGLLKDWPSEVADRKAHPNRKLDSSVYPLGEGPPIPEPSPKRR